MKSKKSVTKEVKKNIFFIIAIILIAISILLYKVVFKSKSTYTVINGYVEKISDTAGIVLKDESIIELKNNTSAAPVIEQGRRVSKNNVIATYKSSSYENYLSQIEQIDNDIQTLVKDLPITYSVDVSNIENEISEITKQSSKTTSYLKMQEYKSKVDELANKKVIILGQLSPAGSKIRELIEKREKIEEENRHSNDNIKAPKSGVVTYKLDNLENQIDISNVLKLTISEIDNLFDKYSSNNLNNFGIKIVNNFLAYFVVKIENGEYDNYIKDGKIYTIKINEKKSIEFSSKLVKSLKDDKNNYLIFEIDNGIENIIDHRLVNLEIIWDKKEGMAVLKDAIKRNEQNTYDYVTVVNGGEYLHVPVKIISSNEGICIVDNFTTEEKKELGIEDNKNKINLYDILVI